MSEDNDWPPLAARVRSARWRAEGHLERREYFAAAAALSPVLGLAKKDEELLRGLHHLAAAGYKHRLGDEARALRQLEHARRRLARFPQARPLLALVERDLES